MHKPKAHIITDSVMTETYLSAVLKSLECELSSNIDEADHILIDKSLQNLDPKDLQKYKSKIIQLTTQPSTGSDVKQLGKPFVINDLQAALKG